MGIINRPRNSVSLFLVLAFSLVIASATDAYLIIDHTCTDITQVPSEWINQAKANFKISYGHTSHGSQIVTGMTVLQDQYGALYDFNYSGSSDALSLHDYEPSGDLGNPDRTTWAQLTRNLLNTPGNDRNLIMWSWCGQVSSATEADIITYLTLMSQLEADYPDVTFIYMTGHLDGTGETGNLHQRNNQIRSHVISHDGVLFDFADIESYDPDGNYFLNRGADDGCYYDGVNWAAEWCALNPGECASCDCAHSQCLNCQQKGKAFWWMMAKLAGWGTTSTTTTIADPNDLDGDGVLNAADNCPTTPNTNQLDTYPPGGNGCGDACECDADCNADQKVDLSDLVMLKEEFMRADCAANPCPADCNYDSKVDLADLVMLKEEFLRTDCPACQ
jgi:hypothetical protein